MSDEAREPEHQRPDNSGPADDLHTIAARVVAERHREANDARRSAELVEPYNAAWRALIEPQNVESASAEELVQRMNALAECARALDAFDGGDAAIERLKWLPGCDAARVGLPTRLVAEALRKAADGTLNRDEAAAMLIAIGRYPVEQLQALREAKRDAHDTAERQGFALRLERDWAARRETAEGLAFEQQVRDTAQRISGRVQGARDAWMMRFGPDAPEPPLTLDTLHWWAARMGWSEERLDKSSPREMYPIAWAYQEQVEAAANGEAAGERPPTSPSAPQPAASPAGAEVVAPQGDPPVCLEALEQQVPPLDKQDAANWCSVADMKKHRETAGAKSWREQRSRGRKLTNDDGKISFGVCERGRIYRKAGRDTWYYVPSLLPVRDNNSPLIVAALRLISTVD